MNLDKANRFIDRIITNKGISRIKPNKYEIKTNKSINEILKNK